MSPGEGLARQTHVSRTGGLVVVHPRYQRAQNTTACHIARIVHGRSQTSQLKGPHAT